jgi:hypothetical protein
VGGAALGGTGTADLDADPAAIEGSFGVLAEETAFSRGPGERDAYLEQLADR